MGLFDIHYGCSTWPKAKFALMMASVAMGAEGYPVDASVCPRVVSLLVVEFGINIYK